jgi:hypothetical protein
MVKADERLKVGLNYGRSRNSDNGPGTGGLKENANYTLGAYYGLNKYVTLVGELGRTRSKGFAGGSSHMNGISVGGVINF